MDSASGTGKPQVSICICTYNRSTYLRDTLANLAYAVDSAPCLVEVIVVDNNSTDDTAAVISDFIASHPHISARCAVEKRCGLSFARNTGVEAASGDVICFLDDDVFLSERWLSGLLAAFDLDARVGAVAGQVLPHWGDGRAPAWMNDQVHGFYGTCGHGERSLVLPSGRSFVGCNFAIKRSAIEAVGLFDTNLGRKGASLLSGEDDDYAARIWNAGLSIAYAAEGLAYHRVHPERLKFGWLARRHFWQGVTTSMRPKNRRISYPLRRLPKLVGNALLLPFAALTFSRSRLYHTCFRAANAAGPFYGWYLLHIKRVAK